MTVLRALLRLYRPIVLWFSLVLVLMETAAVGVVLAGARPGVSLWLVIAGSATKYWLLVVGVLLVVTHLRQFVANGATRREFLLAAAVLGVTVSIAVAVLVPLGHGLENAVLAAADRRATGYPVFSTGGAFDEMGRSLAGSLAYFVSGGLFAIGFYRYPPWTAVALLIPAAVPLVVSQSLLGYDGTATTGSPLPVLPALLVTLAAVAAGAVWLRHAVRDVPIRPTPA